MTGYGRESYHFDLHERFGAIVQKITRFSAVNTHDTQEQLPTEAESQRTAGSDIRLDNHGDVIVDFVLQDLILGELLLEVGSEPDASQRSVSREEMLWKKHAGGLRVGKMGGGWVGDARARAVVLVRGASEGRRGSSSHQLQGAQGNSGARECARDGRKAARVQAVEGGWRLSEGSWRPGRGLGLR